MTELMSIWPAVVVGIGLIVLHRANLRIYDDHFSPLGMLVYSWFVPLWFRSMNLSELETDWTWRSYLGVGSVSAILIVTSLLPSFSRSHRSDLAANRAQFHNSLRVLDSPAAKLFSLTAFVVLFAAYLWNEFITNPAGVALLSALAGRLDQELASYYNWGKIGGRTTFGSVILILTTCLYPLSALLYLQSSRMPRPFARAVFRGLALLPSIFSLMKLSKTDVLQSWLALGLAAYYVHSFRKDSNAPAARRLSPKAAAVLIAAVLVTVPFVLTSVLRVGDQGAAPSGAILIEWIRFRLDEHTPVNTFLATVYTYTALCFENFHRFVNTYDGGTNWGVSALRPILSLLSEGRIAEGMLDQIDFNYVVEGAAIAGTFMTPVFAEGGWFLLVVATLSYGLLINLLYSRLRQNPSYISLLLYNNFSFCWMFMFFSNAFGTLLFYTTALMILVMGVMFSPRTRAESGPARRAHGVGARNAGARPQPL